MEKGSLVTWMMKKNQACVAMKRSTSEKPIVDAFCDDLVRAFDIKAVARAA